MNGDDDYYDDDDYDVGGGRCQLGYALCLVLNSDTK